MNTIRFPEHWRFSDDFAQGLDDAYEFSIFSPDVEKLVSELGFTVTMRKKRHIAPKGAGNSVFTFLSWN